MNCNLMHFLLGLRIFIELKDWCVFYMLFAVVFYIPENNGVNDRGNFLQLIVDPVSEMQCKSIKILHEDMEDSLVFLSN